MDIDIENIVDIGIFNIIVSVCAMVSGSINVNRNRICLFTTIDAPVELATVSDVIVFGDRFDMYVVHVSILEPDIHDVIVIGSDGC